jgi:hypothetical protein
MIKGERTKDQSGDGTIETGRPLYSISKEEFDPAKSPSEPETYNVGDVITRKNFIDFLIKSFAISRGNTARQIVFFVWLMAETQFD